MILRLRNCFPSLLACLLITIGGCGNPLPPPLEPPPIDPAAAGAAALEQYDTNHDGAIAGPELDKCPALKFALARFDNGGDGRVTADSIAKRIGEWQATKVGLSRLGVIVTLDGKPLAGATVTAEPEKFLGPNVLPATGMTGNSGSAVLQISPEKPGVHVGLYKIRISKQTGGREAIPARYNTATELGVEVARGVPELMGGAITYALKSR